MKKVVRDTVSNYLRKEHYDIVRSINIDQQSEDEDFLSNGNSNSFLEHYEFANEIKAEDLIYFDQLVMACYHNLLKTYKDIYHLQHYLVFRLALHEVINRCYHPFFNFVGNKHMVRYNFYVYKLQSDLAPILNQQYLKISLID
jgi:hypothetical protein